MRYARQAVFGAVLATALWAGPSFAETAPDPADAAAHLDNGARLYKKGDFSGALAEFEAAHRLSGSWKVLVHVGMAERRLGRFTDALGTLGRYLARGGSEIPEGSRDIVKREMAEMRALLAEVTIVVDGGDAEIQVDRKVVGRAPLKAPLLLDPGKHIFAARRAGFEGAEQELTLKPGPRQVRLALVPRPGTLRVDTRPSGARVLVDGRQVGHAPWEDDRVAAGPHQVQVQLRGYLERREVVDLGGGRTRALAFDLVAEPLPAKRPWYRRWYVWTVVGGAVAAGAVTAAVVATRPQYDVVLK